MYRVNPPWAESSQCPSNRTERREFGLVNYQSRMCRRMPELMPIITKAAQQTVDVCQSAFKDQRWNCTNLRQAPALKSDLSRGTREQAFVYALSSAAITHQAAKACWKGCSDNVAYGKRMSREWADAMWRKLPQFTVRKRKGELLPAIKQKTLPVMQSVLEFDGELLNEEPIASEGRTESSHESTQQRRWTNRHTTELVPQVPLPRSVDCWYTLPSLDVIAQQLKERYKLAHQIGQPQDSTGSKSDARSARDPFNTKLEPELIFIRPSPSYCDESSEWGSLGTRDRECTHNTTDSSSCENLCCGRGFNTQQIKLSEQCNCRFKYCCVVKCDVCERLVEKHYCK
ncbi:Protein Wnt [Aphelenchoides fujianensis]|nr:Protein Wnt [Aphelenchoides fujianensis]